MSYGISALVSAISADVVSALSTAGYPALTDGGILMGRQHQFEQSAPPRILLIPVASTFGPRASASSSYLAPPGSGGNASGGVNVLQVQMTSYGSGYTSPSVSFTGGGGSGASGAAVVSNGVITRIVLSSGGSGYTSVPTVVITDGTGTGASATARLAPASEYQSQMLQRALYTESVTFECRCWGVVPSTDDPNGDFDFTQTLYQQVIRSCRGLAVGAFRPQPRGEWTDANVGESQLFRNGREFVFRFEMDVPILDQLLAFSPAGVLGSATVEPSGAPGDAVTVVE